MQCVFLLLISRFAGFSILNHPSLLFLKESSKDTIFLIVGPTETNWTMTIYIYAHLCPPPPQKHQCLSENSNMYGTYSIDPYIYIYLQISICLSNLCLYMHIYIYIIYRCTQIRSDRGVVFLLAYKVIFWADKNKEEHR